MFIKYIVCSVPERNRGQFSEAQESWNALKDTGGYLGQFGGWDSKRPSDACIVALWRNESTYRDFMDNIHDSIASESGQDGLYDSISVSLCRSLMDIRGNRGNILAALDDAGFLRLVDCKVKTERESHFIEMQGEVWNPGMARTRGMLAGLFSRTGDTLCRYIVMTLWSSEEEHHAYVENVLPSLRARAGVVDDIVEMVGRRVKLVTEWTVSGSRGGNDRQPL